MYNLEFYFSKKKLIKTFVINTLSFMAFMAFLSIFIIMRSDMRTGQKLTPTQMILYYLTCFVVIIVISAFYSFTKHKNANTKIEFIYDNIYFHSKSREKRGFNTNEIKAIRVIDSKMEFIIGDLIHFYSLDAMSNEDIEKIKEKVDQIQERIAIRNS